MASTDHPITTPRVGAGSASTSPQPNRFLHPGSWQATCCSCSYVLVQRWRQDQVEPKAAPTSLPGLCRGRRMSPGPSITLKLLAGIASLALSVRGWHSPEMAVLGAGLFLRAGFDLEHKRPTNVPRSRYVELRVPRRLVPLGLAAAPLGRKAQPEWRAWATRDRRADPAQVPLDRDWLAAQLQRTSAPAADSASQGGQLNDDPAGLTPGE